MNAAEPRIRSARWLTVLSASLLAMLSWGCGGAHAQAARAGRAAKMGKYDWLASNSAPAGCPMKLLDGSFEMAGGGSLYIPARILHEGWGENGSSHVVGDDFKALPERMWILFYSYFEDKFYRGQFELPAARIAQLFANGYRTRRNTKTGHETFRWITAGVAPGGTVAVWVSGIGREVEVFFGQAREVELDWHKATRIAPQFDRRETIEETIAQAAGTDPLVQVRRQNLDLSLWSRYRDRYDLRYAFEGFDLPEVIEVHSLNGEKEDVFFPQDDASRQARRGAPSFINFSMKELGKQVDLTFDEEETMATLKRMAGAGQPVELVFRREFIDGRPMFGVYVRNARETVELEQLKMKFFSL